MNPLRIVWLRREMLVNLVLRELKSRYKSSVLGFLWSLLTPLFMAAIYVFFLRLLARGVPLENVIIGVFAWQFTAQAVSEGLASITSNGNLVKKVYFPRFILPTATTCGNLVNYLLSLIIQFVLVAVLLAQRGEMIQWTVVFVPLVIVYHTLFLLAVSYFLSAANVYFRDAQHLVGVLISAWFFTSPAMYDLSMVEHVAASRPVILDLYMMNPLAVIITAYRALIIPGASLPLNWGVAVGAMLPVVLLVAGYFVFQRAQRNFADML
jgi:ABC-type polysaccharide/polyol phosphate export permease